MYDCSVIPANPGYKLICNVDGDITVLDDHVIAWRIETSTNADSKSVSTCVPVTLDGDAPYNCIGVQHPDMTITVYGPATYKNIEEYIKQKGKR